LARLFGAFGWGRAAQCRLTIPIRRKLGAKICSKVRQTSRELLKASPNCQAKGKK